ncbi:hypothetical protein Pat9b_4726 (plasmid) [Pantoea sp. At-9b]|nr:hypothetical protein Pat9b_4726 [Pantoea sp. At-9b]
MMPSGARPVTGLRVTQATHLWQTLFKQQLFSAYWFDGHRRKKDTAALGLKAPLFLVVTAFINQLLQFRPSGPGDGCCSAVLIGH